MKLYSSALTRVVTLLFLSGLLFSLPAFAANEAETGELIVKLLQSGRVVITEHQELINDPAKGNKGFTPDYMADKMIQKYREKTGIDLSQPAGVPQSGLLLTLLESGKEVVAEAQPVRNK